MKSNAVLFGFIFFMKCNKNCLSHSFCGNSSQILVFISTFLDAGNVEKKQFHNKSSNGKMFNYIYVIYKLKL